MKIDKKGIQTLLKTGKKDKKMAERGGFEPPVPFRAHTLSRRAPSASRSSLRINGILGIKIAASSLTN